ncbi:hypothetical protein N7359_01815 [Stenotrophomonas maltophilia]|uniref:hypothetical protein n=1 Tax=Stenotrophomonas maltophilia TaxID=40324 RepID=UPI00244A982F|nr:hypothetical protein [Stenotrophomonas maltophilia]MDH0071278.1 hypothetical protein [Stenotrophomonas maltophilia]MDH0104125.1 hypothetical protein [Stenotrophomonas maltophilia]MDH0330226.1 hypothetical protein [Stenotrophomonas maltophilia]
MHLIASPLLICPALSPRERFELSAPYRYWVSAALEQHRWLLASLGVGSGVEVTEGTAVKRRRQRTEMRQRRCVFLQQARQQRERVRHELALRLVERGLAVRA